MIIEQKIINLISNGNLHDNLIYEWLENGGLPKLNDLYTINKIDYRGYSLLNIAIENYYDILHLIIDYNIDINNYEGFPPLITAVVYNRIDVVRLLIDYGADINIIYLDTPLIYAAHNGNLEIVKLLVERGADINYLNIYNKNAILTAFENCYSDEHIEIIYYLLEKDADILQMDVDGWNCFTHSLTKNNKIKYIKPFLQSKQLSYKINGLKRKNINFNKFINNLS